MEKGLSKREKMLMAILGVIVLIAVSLQFLLLPAFAAKTESSGLREDAQAQQEEIDSKLMQLESLKLLRDQSRERVMEKQKIYPVPNTNYKLDKAVTDLCASVGISPKSLTIGASRNAIYVDPNAKAEEKKEKEKQAKDKDLSKSAMIITTVTVKAPATQEQVLALLKAVQKQSDVRVKSISYSNPLDQNAAINYISSVEVVFDVYIRNKMEMQ